MILYYLYYLIDRKCSPFKATFEIESPRSLKSTVIPVEEWSKKLDSANELFALVGYKGHKQFMSDDEDEMTPEGENQFKLSDFYLRIKKAATELEEEEGHD